MHRTRPHLGEQFVQLPLAQQPSPQSQPIALKAKARDANHLALHFPAMLFHFFGHSLGATDRLAACGFAPTTRIGATSGRHLRIKLNSSHRCYGCGLLELRFGKGWQANGQLDAACCNNRTKKIHWILFDAHSMPLLVAAFLGGVN